MRCIRFGKAAHGITRRQTVVSIPDRKGPGGRLSGKDCSRGSGACGLRAFAADPPDLIAGTADAEDAGVIRMTEDLALVQTLDFLTPVTDNPRDFGRIAAANSLSDVYAMGGTPVTAMNIVCFPACDYPEEVLTETLAGGLEKIREAEAVLVGGHSVDDPEFKYGLSVTGRIHPKRVIRNGGARTGDVLILTKPVGAGILATAVKAKLASPAAEREMVENMAFLNRWAAEILVPEHPSALTDITGFGLAGMPLKWPVPAGRRSPSRPSRCRCFPRSKGMRIWG